MEAILFSSKRSGSTFLQEAFDSHPKITSMDELFIISGKDEERRGIRLFKIYSKINRCGIDGYLNWVKKKGENTIFRLMYNQNDKVNVLPVAMKRGMPIIHLKRNPVDIVISTMAKNTKVKPNEKFNINLSDFKLRYDNLTKSVQKYTKILKGYNKVLTIDYENMFGEVEGEKTNIESVFDNNIRSSQITYLNENTNDRICDFLKLDNFKMFSTITKIITLPKEEKILNWNEVKGLI